MIKHHGGKALNQKQFLVLVKSGAYITHNANQPLTVGWEIHMCHASSSSCSLESSLSQQKLGSKNTPSTTPKFQDPSGDHQKVEFKPKIKFTRTAVQLNSHFLEEVPVGDDFELLQDEEDPTADEEGLMFGQGVVQQQQVPFTETDALHL